MRFLTTLLFLGGLGYGAYWLNDTKPELKYQLIEKINTGTFQILEARFTPEQIMEKERNALLKNSEHRYSSPTLHYHPYLLMEVKYASSEQQTEEGVILWDLTDGEMVRDTKSWSKTHGFADCVNAGADKYEYKILTTIAKNGGQIERSALLSSLSIEPHLFDAWIERARKKKLIIQNENTYRIHLSSPVLNVRPSTKVAGSLVTKSCKHTNRINKRYSPSQVKKAAEAVFGADFAIRTAQDIFLPIYSITVQNPDGSFDTTHWNALNGKKMNHPNLIQ